MGTKAEAFPPTLQAIVDRLPSRPLPPLVPGRIFDATITGVIEALTPRTLGMREGDFFRCIQSALHLWNDDLDRSHTISQEIHTPTGSYLHGIMHRREPDYENSKYWFRRVGEHPAFGLLLPNAKVLAGKHTADPFAKRLAVAPRWDPFAFVDACESGETEFLQALQLREIELLAQFALAQGRV